MTLTDRLDTIQVLKENVLRNTRQTPDACSADGKPDVEKLEDVGIQDTCGESSLQVKVLDWSDAANELLLEHWDMVIGADIVYIESSFDDLIRTMRTLRCPQLVLSCRLRYAKDHKFIRRAQEYFKVKLIFHDQGRDIKIFSFHLLEST